jgi:hypothetical protein
MHFEIRDGKIARMDDFPVEPYAWESFFSAPGNGRTEVARKVTAFAASTVEDQASVG